MGTRTAAAALKTRPRAADLSLVAVVEGRSAYRRAGSGRTGDDLGLIVVSTLVKTVFWLAVVGLVGYDLISVAVTQFTVRNDAQQAAQIAHDTLRETKSVEKAYAAVVAFATSNGDTVVPAGFSTGNHTTVTVELRRTAKTFVASHLPRVSAYTVGDVSATASDAVN